MSEPIDGSKRGLTPKKPWERRPDESAKAWQSFCCYRDLGSRRTIETVAKNVGRSLGHVLKWSARYAWVGRAFAWDDELSSRAARVKLEKAEEAAKLELEAHAGARQRAWIAAALALDKVLDGIKSGEVKPKPRDCFALGEIALRLSERSVSGQDVEIEKLRARPLPDLAQELVDTVREQFGIEVKPREPKPKEEAKA